MTTEIGIDLAGRAERVPHGDGQADEVELRPGPAPTTASFTRAWTAPEPDPAEARSMVVRFRRAAVALAMSADEGSAPREHARECASALISLASADQEQLLAPVLRADPDGDDVTWTVACYQIGDLSPTTLRDFAGASAAVRTLAGCGEPAHVAAELIVTNGEGVRWTAMVRSGADAAFQLLDAGTASAPSPAALLSVRHRWEDRLMDWAARPSAGLDAPAAPAGSEVSMANITPPATAGSGEAVAVGVALGKLLESVRRIEDRLAPVPASSGPRGPIAGRLPGGPAVWLGSAGEEPAAMKTRLESLEAEVEDLRHELASSVRRVAVLEAALRQAMDQLGAARTEGLVVAGGAAALSVARSQAPERGPWRR